MTLENIRLEPKWFLPKAGNVASGSIPFHFTAYRFCLGDSRSIYAPFFNSFP